LDVLIPCCYRVSEFLEIFQKPPGGLFHSRQAVHAVSAISGFLGRNRLAVHTRPPGDAYGFTRFWNFLMNCLAVMIIRQATRVSVKRF